MLAFTIKSKTTGKSRYAHALNTQNQHSLHVLYYELLSHDDKIRQYDCEFSINFAVTIAFFTIFDRFSTPPKDPHMILTATTTPSNL